MNPITVRTLKKYQDCIDAGMNRKEAMAHMGVKMAGFCDFVRRNNLVFPGDAGFDDGKPKHRLSCAPVAIAKYQEMRLKSLREQPRKVA